MKLISLNLILIFIIIEFSNIANGYKILAIVPFPSKSHYYIGNSIVESLLDAGHEVTIVTPISSNKIIPKRREIIIKEIENVFGADNSPNVFEFGKLSPIVTQMLIYDLGKDNVQKLFSSEKFKELLNSQEKFDAVIYEIFGSDSLVGLGQHFNCPVIGYTTFGVTKWISQINNNPNIHSYIPSPFLSFSGKMTFYQRLCNKLFSIAENLLAEYFYYPQQRKFYKQFFPHSKSTFDQDLKNVSIIFQNSYFASSSPRPYLPDVIEIGGIHVKDPKPLPEELQKYLDSAKDGVIYFSMGSMLQSRDWSVDKRESFIRAFATMKTKVVWKYENETLPNQPANMKIGRWFPQRHILAHPNVRLFITHGGLLGTTESLASGVPVLVIPVYGDQKMNAARAIEGGYGLKLNHEDITEHNVRKLLNELLNNPKYHETAQLISKRFNDRPLTPRQSVAFWTEYVIRHNGAPQLKSPGAELSFIQFHLIDVYISLIAIAGLLSMIIYACLRFIRQKLFEKSINSEKAKIN